MQPVQVSAGPGQQHQGLSPSGIEIDGYRVVRMLGKGGMGEVYLARDTKLGRKVAIKLIAESCLDSDEVRARFLQEARTTALFSHPHIVTIYSVGEHQGRPYVALEYLEGESLRQRMDSGGVTPAACLRVMLAVAQAVAEAHRHGVLHRDLKPENIFLPRDGRVRVLDFGLAKPFDAPELRSQGPEMTTALVGTDTLPGRWMGTPPYMAPEQWKTEPCSGTTDVWAIGVILCEVLSGELPYSAPHPFALALKVSSSEPTPAMKEVPGLPESVRELVAKCLRKDPAERPPIDNVVEALELAVESPGASRTAAESPFRGLLPFTERTAQFFFGREGEIAAFAERLREQTILTVVGASGAGKSSFVQAGVIPRLREQGRWDILMLRPGRDPFSTLASRILGQRTSIRTSVGENDSEGDAAGVERLARELLQRPGALSLHLQQLARSQGTNVLLYVDQLEEIYSLVSDEPVRQAFMRAVCAAADDRDGPVRVVATVRADFLSRVALVPEAREALGNVLVLRAPDEHGLREIVTRSMRRAGLEFDDASVLEDMIRAVSAEPASLALIQFACTMLWERRDTARNLLTRAAYDAMGGVEGALAYHADTLLESLTGDQERAVKQLLLRLVSPDGTRRVLTRGELLDQLPEEAAGVLERLVAGRLLIAHRRGGDTDWVELVHESLGTSWARLRRWREESHEEHVFLEEVESAARLWERRGRRETEVWNGDALREARRKAARAASPVSQLSAEFLERGRRVDDRKAVRKRRSTAALVGALVVVAVSSVVAAIVLANKEAEVRAQRNAAEQGRARAVQAMAQSVLDSAEGSLASGNVVDARAKLRTSLTLADSVRARALGAKLSREPLVWQQREEYPIVSLAWFRQSPKLLVARASPTLFDAETLQVARVPVVGSAAGSLAVSPDGRLAAIADQDELSLIDLQRKALVRTSESHAPPNMSWSVSFSPDGKHLAFGTADAASEAEPFPINIVDTPTGTMVRKLAGHAKLAALVRYSSNDRYLLSVAFDQSLRVWAPATGKRLVHLDAQRWAEFSPDGQTLLTVGSDEVIHLRDPATGESRHSIVVKAPVRAAAMHPDGRRFAVAGEDGSLRIVDREGHVERVIVRNGPQFGSFGFSADGRLLAAGTWDGWTRVWRLDLPSPELTGPTTQGTCGASTPSGDQLATGEVSGNIWLWDRATALPIDVLHGHTDRVNAMLFDASGDRLYSASNDGTIRIWDMKRLGQSASWQHGGAVVDIAMSPDGKTVASVSTERVRLWDVERGILLHDIPAAGSAPVGIEFMPDGARVVVAEADGRLAFWNAPSGDPAGSADIGKPTIGLAVSKQTIATVHGDDKVLLWDSQFRKSRTRVAAAPLLPQNTPAVNYNSGVSFAGLDASGDRLAAGGRESYLIDLRSDGPALLLRDPMHVAQTFAGNAVLGVGSPGAGLWDATTGHPIWRLGVFLPDALVTYSHRGWRSIEDGSVWSPPTAQWRTAVEERSISGDSSLDGGLLCMLTHDGFVEIWDRHADRQLVRSRLEGLFTVAMRDGCLVTSWSGLNIVQKSGTLLTLKEFFFDFTDSEIYVQANQTIRVLDSSAREIATYPSNGELYAATRTASMLAVAYNDGTVEVRSLAEGKVGPPRVMERVPELFPILFAAGPGETLVGTFLYGDIAVWDTRTGALLLKDRVAGKPARILVRGNKIYVVSHLGYAKVLDISGLTVPYCDALRSVWNEVPVVWQDGAAVPQRPPADHPCARAGQRPPG